LDNPVFEGCPFFFLTNYPQLTFFLTKTFTSFISFLLYLQTKRNDKQTKDIFIINLNLKQLMKKSSFLLGGVLLLSTLFLTSCDKVMSKLDNPVSSYLQIDQTDLVLAVGAETTRIAETITTEAVTYTSSAPEVATVDEITGKVIAVAPGEAVITANVKANDYYMAGTQSYKVKVLSITLNKTEAPIGIDGHQALTATILPADAFGYELKWSSDNEKVATVSETGDVKAIAEGTANGIKAVCALTTKDKVDLSTLTGNYVAEDGDVLTGVAGGPTDYIYVGIPAGASVTFSDATVYGYVYCSGDAAVFLAEGTNNTIYGRKNTALKVGPESTTLTIKGKGQMNVYGDAWRNGRYAAAIGSNCAGSTMGDITIKGGTVTATQQQNAGSGIGSGMGYSGESHCGNITISGGTVVAYGGFVGAGIGAGGLYYDDNDYACSCGNITITGGNVTAYGGSYAAGIGTGIKYDSGYTNTPVCGDITISGGTVVATKGDYALYDVGPGEYSGNTGIWTGQVGTVNVSVAVKDYYGNDATIYTPEAASAPSRRANADNMSLPLAPDSDVQPKVGKSLR